MTDIRIIPGQGAINVTGSANFRGASNSSVLFITGSGGVGVGTTIPASEFHIKGSSTRFVTLDRTGTRSYDIGINSSKTLLITDNTAEADRIALTLSGSVGIGSTSPAVPLDVVGKIRSVNANDQLTIKRSDNTGTRIGHDALGLYFANDDASLAVLRIYGGTSGAERFVIGSGGAVKLNSYGSGTNTGTAAYTLRVDSSGNIIEDPIGAGAVDGTGTVNYITKWSDSDTITNSVMYDDGTNVGVG